MTHAEEVKVDHIHICPHKFAFMLDNWIRKLFQNPRRIVGEYIQKGDTVIDVGCGPGFFSIEMAKLVGEKGRVIAVDLQEEMLAAVRRKAMRKGVSHNMEYHPCGSNAIGLNCKADFILAYYMVHETPDPKAFLAELKDLLNDDGRILVVEPRLHVGKNNFQSILQDAESVGLKILTCPKKKGGRSVLLSL